LKSAHWSTGHSYNNDWITCAHCFPFLKIFANKSGKKDKVLLKNSSV